MCKKKENGATKGGSTVSTAGSCNLTQFLICHSKLQTLEMLCLSYNYKDSAKLSCLVLNYLALMACRLQLCIHCQSRLCTISVKQIEGPMILKNPRSPQFLFLEQDTKISHIVNFITFITFVTIKN